MTAAARPGEPTARPVKVASARVTPFRLRLSAQLDTAHGSLAQRHGWLLELHAEDGARGVGEASPLPGFGLIIVRNQGGRFRTNPSDGLGLLRPVFWLKVKIEGLI